VPLDIGEAGFQPRAKLPEEVHSRRWDRLGCRFRGGLAKQSLDLRAIVIDPAELCVETGVGKRPAGSEPKEPAPLGG